MLGAAPAWFANNLWQIAVGTLAVVTVLILRVIHKVALRTTLLMLVVVAALLIYANHEALEECARTCECRLARSEVHVPTCQSDLNL